MKRLVLELGGKDPMIVLPGADLEAAAQARGDRGDPQRRQVCVAVERVLVHQDIAEAFSRRVAEIVRGLRVGDPRDETTQIGPMANARAARAGARAARPGPAAGASSWSRARPAAPASTSRRAWWSG
jgi:acyl-CoA reductase-like NAD-dependent aldehyde dehydrogenase